MLVAAFQESQYCTPVNVLVTIGQWTTDMSRTGVNKGESITVLKDGRFRILRRVQTLPSTTLAREGLESKLSPSQLTDLLQILKTLRVSEAPPINRTFPLNAVHYNGASVKLQVDGKIKQFGFWQTPSAASNEVKQNVPNDNERNWSKSREILKPLLEWSQQIEAMKLKPLPSPEFLICPDATE